MLFEELELVYVLSLVKLPFPGGYDCIDLANHSVAGFNIWMLTGLPRQQYVHMILFDPLRDSIAIGHDHYKLIRENFYFPTLCSVLASQVSQGVK